MLNCGRDAWAPVYQHNIVLSEICGDSSISYAREFWASIYLEIWAKCKFLQNVLALQRQGDVLQKPFHLQGHVKALLCLEYNLLLEAFGINRGTYRYQKIFQRFGIQLFTRVQEGGI